MYNFLRCASVKYVVTWSFVYLALSHDSSPTVIGLAGNSRWECMAESSLNEDVLEIFSRSCLVIAAYMF